MPMKVSSQPNFPFVSVEEVISQPNRTVKFLTVRFIMLMRIDLSGKLQNPINFSSLIKAANKGGRALFWAHEQKGLSWEGKGLVLCSERVKMIRWEQNWMELQRFSRRQSERLKIGDVAGSEIFVSGFAETSRSLNGNRFLRREPALPRRVSFAVKLCNLK